jgi:hypothetical protein
MASFIVGTMTTASGWETQSPPDALAKHITYWFQSRRNQGKVMGNVPSFYYLIKQYGGKPETLLEKCNMELEQYIKELFPVCSVTVTRENLTGKTNQYTLIIAARIVSDNVAYDLARSVLVTGEEYKLLDAQRLR